MDYQIKRARRKTAAIHVTPQGVEVRVPYGIDESWIQGFVHSKYTWIKQQQARLAERTSDQPKLAFGETIWFFGQRHTLVYEAGSRRSVTLQGNQLICVSPTEPNTETLKTLLENWFKQQAKHDMPQRTYARAQQLGVMDRLNQIRFRRTKSKWGHCTSTGNLQFNWQIMGAPEAVVDYLICHEVSHLLEHNHSKRFWQHVAALCPDYKVHQQWLKRNGHQLNWH